MWLSLPDFQYDTFKYRTYLLISYPTSSFSKVPIGILVSLLDYVALFLSLRADQPSKSGRVRRKSADAILL